ncbi:MAG TPA: hypothetical protein VKF17_15780 [Isosphaeraceae bacterium]|nr:hypothetical protein [Isosphaeraceae bacterium]
MSIALEWLAVMLIGFAGTPEPKADGPEVIYQFQVVEVHGLQWREAAGHGLKPVASRGGVTVWTAPRDFFKTLPKGTTKEVVTTPRVTAFSQVPAHLTIRNNHPFVTQVAWRGEGVPPRQTTDTVREGMTTTIAGRCIDQGVLAQLVIEDTDIRSVHMLNVPAPATASVSSSKVEPAGCPATVSIIEHVHNLVALEANGTRTVTAEEAIIGFDQPLSFKHVFDQPISINRITVQDITCTQDAKSGAGCDATCPAAGHAKAADEETKKAGLHADGEEPCSADDEANAAACRGSQAASSPAEKATWSPTRSAQVQIPEIGHAEIAGEWLIPRDQLLLVGFGPHTVADKDGKAVVRERLALITAEEVALPTASTGPETLELPRPLPRVAVSPPRLEIPAIPSRSLPQGVHADGTPAELPPLPDEEKADPPPGDSSQPRPSPQTKKPHHGTAPAANPTAKPPAASADNGITNTAFELAKGLLKANTLPQFTFPNLQFVMPLKPFAMKLPFNQKLELELIGRVVPDSETASAAPPADE